MQNTKCFDIFLSCVNAIHDGKLIIPESPRDKEFHFQNWCQLRIEESGVLYEAGGRNTYPDFRLVEFAEGYEIKGLACPGRESDFDANSNLPSGFFNGRQIFYMFGRYPLLKADLSRTITREVNIFLEHIDTIHNQKNQ